MSAPDPLIGTVMQGRYRIEAELGEGGMGSVYRAEHVALGRTVAVKVLRDELAASAEFRQRFEREATVLSGLSHPNIVSVLDYGFEAGLPFLVMEFLQGRDLDDVLKQERPSPLRAGVIAKQILRAVGHAHTHGLVHRDLKPQNVIVRELADGTEHVTVLDFGLARQVEGDSTVTKTGLLMGTPAYMSPEQATGAKTDARSDVYSLGIVLYELFAGEHPFKGEKSHELLRSHLLKDPKPLHLVAPVDANVAALVTRAMSKHPSARFEDANAMLAAFGTPRIEERETSVGSGPPAVETRALETRVAKRGTPQPSAPSPEPSSGGTQTPGRSVPQRAAVPRNVRWAIAAASVATLVLIAATLALSGDEPDPVRPQTVIPILPGPLPSKTANSSALVEPSVDRAPRDTASPSIWQGGEYGEMLARLRQDRPLGRGQLRSLAVQARRAPDDVRPLLLLGHSYVLNRSLSDGMDRYEAAFAIDGSIVNEEWTADDLITIAAAESLHRRATRLIVEHYDADFAARVDRRAQGERGPWRGRLEALARRLRN